MVKQKVVIGVFRHAKSKSGLYYGLASSAPLQGFGNFIVQAHDGFLPAFRKIPSFWEKLGSRIFQNIRTYLL